MVLYRLLDIGVPNHGTVNLCLTSNRPFSGPHKTLSHCWGKIPTIRLLTSTINRIQQGIKLDELPTTFQEAVNVTRHSGVRCLWIDSLCIVQDSPDDRREEAASIQDVYTNSHLNPAATASASSMVGLFRTRDPGSLQPCTVQPA